MSFIRILITLLLAVFIQACASISSLPAPSVEVRQLLAPTGTLRIAVLSNSPMSMVRDSSTGQTRGVAFELGTALATRLGVPYQVIEFGAFAEVASAIATGRADIGMFNASSPRAAEVWVAPTLLSQQATYLVAPGSNIQAISGIDVANVRIGVQQNSSSQGTLARTIKTAVIVPVPNLQNVPQMLTSGQLNAFATNKGILNDLMDRTPGSRILDGGFATENQSLAIPKGREAASTYLISFLEDARRTGLIKDAADRARLRGVELR